MALPLVATKWLDSVSVVLCGIMSMHLTPWHVVQIFFRKKKSLKKGLGYRLAWSGRVGLQKKMGRPGVGPFFIQAKEFKFRLGKNGRVWVRSENFGPFCHVKWKIMHPMKHEYACTAYALNVYPHSKVKSVTPRPNFCS